MVGTLIRTGVSKGKLMKSWMRGKRPNMLGTSGQSKLESESKPVSESEIMFMYDTPPELGFVNGLQVPEEYHGQTAKLEHRK